MLKNVLYAEHIKFISIVAYFVASNWVIIERVWAIINLKGYETRKEYKFIVAVIFGQWFVSAGGYWLAVQGYLPVMLFLIPGIILTISSVLVYRYMDRKNKRKYRLSKSVGNAYTLTERYQLAENIKTAPLVLAMINVNITLNTMVFVVS
uniref:Uncharacterized protein n=1 Tax=Panagrolaimus davidi TaxID=227884 RepID=A0A914PD52_9BILA